MTLLDTEGLYEDDPGKMTLFSGKAVNPLRLSPGDIDIVDIAHALSRQCRYNGHVKGYLSVARHCIWVAYQLRAQGYGPKVQLAGLLHDAAEAYMGDMIRPLKHGEVGEAYMAAEATVEATIFAAFNVSGVPAEVLHEADNFILLNVELPEKGARWTWDSEPETDRHDYLMLFHELYNRMSARREHA